MTDDSHLFVSSTDLENQGWTKLGNVFQKDSQRYVPLMKQRCFSLRPSFRRLRQSASKFQGHILPSTPLDSLADPFYSPMPRYWVPKERVQTFLEGKWGNNWFLTFRNVTNDANARSVISAVIPLQLWEIMHR